MQWVWRQRVRKRPLKLAGFCVDCSAVPPSGVFLLYIMGLSCYCSTSTPNRAFYTWLGSCQVHMIGDFNSWITLASVKRFSGLAWLEVHDKRQLYRWTNDCICWKNPQVLYTSNLFTIYFNMGKKIKRWSRNQTWAHWQRHVGHSLLYGSPCVFICFGFQTFYFLTFFSNVKSL